MIITIIIIIILSLIFEGMGTKKCPGTFFLNIFAMYITQKKKLNKTVLIRNKNLFNGQKYISSQL